MGYFVEPRNIPDLVLKLEKFILNEEIRVSCGEYNYEYAMNHVLSSVVAKRLYYQLTEVLDEKRGED